MYEIFYLLTRLLIMIAVALQDLFRFEAVFYCNERNVRLIGRSDKEDERFLSYEFLIVAHTSDAVMKRFTFCCKLCGAFCKNCYEYALSCLLQG